MDILNRQRCALCKEDKDLDVTQFSKTLDGFARCYRQCLERRSGKYRTERKAKEKMLYGADKENGESEEDEEEEESDEQIQKEFDNLNVPLKMFTHLPLLWI